MMFRTVPFKIYLAFTYLFLMLNCSSIYGQNNTLSIEKQFNNTKKGSTERFELTTKYTQHLLFNNQIEKAFEVINATIEEAKKISESKYAATLSTAASFMYLLIDEKELSTKHAKAAHEYALRTKDEETKGYICYGKGWLAVRNSKEGEAVKHFLDALNHFEKSKPSNTLQGRKFIVYKELAGIYGDWKEYQLQEKYSHLALETALKDKNPSSIFDAYMSMGFLKEQQHAIHPNNRQSIIEAEKYYLMALDTFQKNKSQMSVPSNLAFVANNLAHLYLNYFPKSDESKVVKYAELAINQGKATNQHTLVASALGILADLATKNNQNENAKSYLLEALLEIEQNHIDGPITKMNILESLSTIHEQEGDYQEALRYYKNYLEVFTTYYNEEKSATAKKLEAQYQGEKQKQELLKLQIESYQKEQSLAQMQWLNTQQAQKFENLQLLKDNQQKEFELSQLEKTKQQQELQLSKLESFNKQKEIELYKSTIEHKERVNLFYIGIATIVSLLLLLFIYAYFQRSKRLRQQKEIYELEIEQERQHSKISNLTTMLEAQEKERGRLARDLHDGLGGLLSGAKMNLSLLGENTNDNTQVNVQHSIDQLDLAVDELRRVAHNLMPDLLQKYGLEEALFDYANRLSNSTLDIDVQFLHYEHQLPQEQQLLVYRIIQELVNNAIKHANASQIIIQFIEHPSNYQVIVEDDGAGFDVQNTNSKSAGLYNIQSRVAFLKGKVTIDSQENLGTTIEIQFAK